MPDPISPHSIYKVAFEPTGKFIRIAVNASLLSAVQQVGLAIISACGGVGSCGQCQVIIRKGSVSPPTSYEKSILTESQILKGMRLACQTHIQSNVVVHIPPSSHIKAGRLQLKHSKEELIPDPLVYAYTSNIPPPTLEDPRSDLQRIFSILPQIPNKTINADPDVIRQISTMARAYNWHLATLLRGSEIIGVVPPDSSPVGLAVDLGTTTIAASLVDLANGKELALAGALNPQISYGEDIISRLTYVYRNDDAAHTLSGILRKTVDNLLGTLLKQTGLNRAIVSEICLVGNTAMTHLFIELPTHQLSTSPYIAATNFSIDIKARDLGITAAPGAYVHILPGIGGFVGADHVAMILSSNLDKTDHVTLGIDIGTNTEIVLAGTKKNVFKSVSCASGPAFEGVHIGDGMRATSGAIETVELTLEGIHLKTIDNEPAIGLCGSGIIDIVAELRRFNIINGGGRFDKHHHRVRKGQHGYEFLLVPASQGGSGHDVVITQDDVNQIQLAKGAIRAGLEILLDSTNTSPALVKEVIFAGAFGSFLNVQNALKIGLIPPLPNAIYKQVGNGSLAGAKWALISKQARVRAQEIAHMTTYLELSTYPDFSHYFAQGMLFFGENSKKKSRRFIPKIMMSDIV